LEKHPFRSKRLLVVLVFPEALEEGTIKSNNESRISARNRMERVAINFHGGKMENLPRSFLAVAGRTYINSQGVCSYHMISGVYRRYDE
jgi:hypothetical protein